MAKIKDLIGQKFGRLTVLENCGNKKYCKCDCGNYTHVLTNHLLSGHTQSCGCLKMERISRINGLSKTRLYKIWESMHTRCECSKHRSYSRYKDKKICDEWHKSNKGFLNFYNWAIANGYDDKLTIDRIDNNLGYNPENCRWVTYKEQNTNLSTNVWVKYKNNLYTLKNACLIANISEMGVKHTVKRKGLSHQEFFDLHLNNYFDVKLQKWVPKEEI